MVKGRRLLDTDYEAYLMPLNTIIEKMEVKKTKSQKFIRKIEEKLNNKKRRSSMTLLERLHNFFNLF